MPSRLNILRAVLLMGGALLLFVGYGQVSARMSPLTTAIAPAEADQLPGTLATMTRRLWPADPNKWFEVNCVFPDGRRIGASTDSELGGVTITDLNTGDESKLIDPERNPAYGYVEDCAVSPDGSKVAYTDYSWRTFEETGGGFQELRVISTTGGESRQIRGQERYPNPDVGWMWIRGWTPDGGHVLVGEHVPIGNRELVHLVADPAGTSRELPVAYDSFEFGFSPDGRYLAYDDIAPSGSDGSEGWSGLSSGGRGRPRDGKRDLFVFDLKTNTKTTLLAAQDDDLMVGWTPDGSHVLFLRNRGRGPAVYRLPVSSGRATGEPELVLPDAWGFIPVGFTTSGSYLYALRTGITELYVATLADDGRRMVTPPARLTDRDFRNATHPDWHPDGKQVAYLVHDDPNYMSGGSVSLVVRSLEAGITRTYSPPDGYAWATNPRWSDNGRSIFISARREGAQGTALLRVDAASGATETIVEPRSSQQGLPTWRETAFDVTADGRYLYYGTRTAIIRRDLRTGEERELWTYQGDDNHWIYWVDLSPDEQMLLAQSYHGGNARFVLPANGGEARVLASNEAPPPESHVYARGITDGFRFAGNRESLGWSPGGKALLLAMRNAEDQGRYAMFRAPLEGGTAEPIGLEFEKPWNAWHDVVGKVRFHPDGRRVVFSAGLREQELWVMENFLPKDGQR